MRAGDVERRNRHAAATEKVPSNLTEVILAQGSVCKMSAVAMPRPDHPIRPTCH